MNLFYIMLILSFRLLEKLDVGMEAFDGKVQHAIVSTNKLHKASASTLKITHVAASFILNRF